MAGRITLATTIANLAVVLTAKTAQFSAGLTRARKKLQRFGTRVAAVSRKLALFSAVAVGAGAALATIYIRRTMQAVDATAKMADRIGIAIEELQRLRHAAALSGMALGKMDLLLLQFVRRMGEAQQGLTTYSRAFDQIGLDVKAMAQMDVYEAFMLSIEGIRALTQDTLRASVAYNMFGRQGQQAVNMIMAGRKAIEEAGAAVDKAGAAINRIDAAKIEMANDAITQAKLTMVAFWQDVTVPLSVAIKAAADWMFDLGTETIKTGVIIDEVFSAAGRTVGWFADLVKTVYSGILQMNIGIYTLLTLGAKGVAIGGGGVLSEAARKKAEYWEAMLKAALEMKRELDAMGLGGRIEIGWEKLVANAEKLAQAIAKDREEMRLARKVGQGVANTIADLQKRAEALVLSMRDPWQVLTDSIDDYRKMLAMLFISENDYLRAIAKAYEVYYKAIEKVKDSLRALADPARLRFAPAVAAGTAEAVRTQWRAGRGVIGAATVAVQQQQLKVQQGIGETLEEMNNIMRRGLFEDVAVLDVVA